MANSFTTLGFIKPEVGADTNLWGGHWNQNADLVDALTQRFVGTTTTRLLQFNVDAVSTSTTRTVTWRDTSGTVALTSDVPPLRSYLAGLTLSTAGSSATFGIAAGVATDSTNVAALTLASAFTKTTSAWAVGTGNGSLDTSTIANSTWYHVHLIQRVDTGLVDVLISLSATAPTMPASYTLSRRIGAMKTNGSAQWTSFIQIGDKFLWLAPVLDIDATNSGSSAVTRTLASSPTGIVVEPILDVTIDATTASTGEAVLLTALAQTDTGPVTAANCQVSLFGSNAAAQQNSSMVNSVFTNTSAQIRSRQTNGAAAHELRIKVFGWIDRRGRDD